MTVRIQRGAALLTAMLTVTLVASLASAALWQQWRSTEAEHAERSRAQMRWMLNGALDWARLILREDARTSQVDHLSEPWALPLQEARLSGFLAAGVSEAANAADNPSESTVLQAFLSGRIQDQQARLNVRNLVQEGRRNEAALRAFARLFDLLNLRQEELLRFTDQLLRVQIQSSLEGTAQRGPPDQGQALPVLLTEQTEWLGLSPSSLRALRPYITLLPAPTPVNLNTAGVEVLMAVLPGLEILRAQQLVAHRAASPFLSVQDALAFAGIPFKPADAALYSVGTRYFSVQARLRWDDMLVTEESLLERNGQSLRVVWRQFRVPGSAGASLQ
jgi:general secretion pathway protein K